MLSAPMVPVSRSSARAVVQLYATVAETTGEHLETQPHAELDKIGYVNQHGLSRKVMSLSPSHVRNFVLTPHVAVYF